MADIHQKYDFLLHPIKDLMKNWQIDIAGVLEDYLGEILKMTFSFDGGKTRLNFAEASFLIQGTACVWSRKVEYLHALVYQTLDMITNNKLAKQPTSIDAQGVDNDATFDDHEDKFLNLNDTGCLASKRLTDSGEIVLPLPLRWALIDRTDSANRGSPLFNEKGEITNYYYDFWANCTTPLDHGSALIEKPFGGEESKVNCNDERKDSEQAGEVSTDTAPFDVDVANDDDDHMDDEGNDGQDALEELLSCTNEVTVIEKRQLRQRVMGTVSDKQSAPRAASPTNIPLNPHDECTTWTSKSFCKGKTIRLPPSLPQSTRKRKKEAAAESLPLFNVFVECMKKSLKGEETTAMRVEKKRRAAWRKSVRATHQGASHGEDLEPFADDVFHPDGENLGDASDIDDVGGTELDELVNDIMECNGAPGADLPAQLAEDHVTLETYEDLVRHHVEKFYATAKLFQQETALAQRVKQWEVSITPMLDEQDNRPEFDIHKYGDELVSNFDGVGEEKYFRDVTSGDDTWSVCRRFAATLQLANDSNFQLESGGDTLSGSVNTLKLKLLSHRRLRDRLDEYVPLT